MNIKDIAHIACVSPSTVSKIMNGKDSSISSETREKVLEVVRQYHYVPYSASTAQGKTWTIGVLLRSSISFDSTLDGIIQTAQTNGYGVLIFNSYADTEQELKNITSLDSHNVDGIIWEPVSAESLKYASYLKTEDSPVLTIGPFGGDQTLLIPYRETAYRLTYELIERGHQSIGCLMTKGRRTKDFLEGFRACLFEHNLQYNPDSVYYNLDETMLGKINSHTVTGFVSSHYRKALEFTHFMQSMHYRVPEDVSLVSVKNDTNETLLYPENSAISTYTIRNADFGSYLCEKLINTLEKRPHQPHSFVQDFHLDNVTTVGDPSTSQIKNVTVVGSLNIDTRLSVSQLPTEGSTVTTRTASHYPGGKGINQAVGVAKLGHKVSLIGNVGSDSGADYIFSEMQRLGVKTEGIQKENNFDTGKAYIFVDNDGDSMISIISGANSSLTPEDIQSREHLFERSEYCLIQSEIPLETVAAACRTAHRYRSRTVVKPSSCEYMPDKLLSEIDILVPNINELNTLQPGEGSMEQKAQQLHERGAKCVIVTEGEKGCYIFTDSFQHHYPVAEFTSIDNTGAGDAFISALVSYLIYGYSLTEAIPIASFAAGFSTTREGVVPSLIDRFTLDSHIPQILEKEMSGDTASLQNPAE